MKVWFDKQDIRYNTFISEQFLLLPLFDRVIINQNKDFVNSEKWQKGISEIIEYVDDVDVCDVIIYPNKLDIDIKKYIDISITSSKKLLCFYNDDNELSTCLPDNVHVYRTSLIKQKRKQNEYSMPAWSCDFTDLVDIVYREKGISPVVGFCGAITHDSRYHVIETLKENINIEKHFKIRDSFWGGSIHNKFLRDEYVQHMSESDFILCCRGAGNFSYRLYECLSLGRIPIIINTDVVLPCDDIINWQDLGIWIDDITNINDIINKFWSKLTYYDYSKKQKTCRSIYEKFLSPEGFARYLSNKYTTL